MRSNKDVSIPVISLVPAGGVCENCGQWQWVTRDERRVPAGRGALCAGCEWCKEVTL